MKNIDLKTVAGFGREWSSFDQNGLSEEDKSKIFDDYFHIFPWDKLSPNAVGADIGCGSGRWAQVVAPRVGHLHLIDASQEALQVAKNNVSLSGNCSFHHASVGDLPFNDNSLVKYLIFLKSINLLASFHKNSLLLIEAPEESFPHNFTPLMMKGITDVFILIPPAFPQAATIPLGLT